MVNVHECDKTHSCDTCGKKFYLKWRLKKHLEVHEPNVNKCRIDIITMERSVLMMKSVVSSSMQMMRQKILRMTWKLVTICAIIVTPCLKIKRILLFT